MTERGRSTGASNGQAPAPLALEEVVARAKRVALLLYAEWQREEHDSRWFRAPSEGLVQVARGTSPSDRTAGMAASPDRVNQGRADRIERTLRRVCRELEDCVAKQPSACQAEDDCCEPAEIRGKCRRHYRRDYQRARRAAANGG
ncbi:MAG: hypothetical protein M3O70_21590 [Actinomycetota bacterium]|nr:hypothetical protein [Actinomycetota bacterium]